MTTGGVFLYTGDTGSGKTGKGLADVAESLRVRLRGVLMLDLESASTFKGLPHVASGAEAEEIIYAAKPGRAVWTPAGLPDDFSEVDGVLRGATRVGDLVVFIDGVRWLAKYGKISPDLTRLLLKWRHGEDGPNEVRATNQRTNLPDDFYATSPVHYIFKSSVPEDLSDIERRYGYPRAEIEALKRAEDLQGPGEFRVYPRGAK